jgi:hypothetical protein
MNNNEITDWKEQFDHIITNRNNFIKEYDITNVSKSNNVNSFRIK